MTRPTTETETLRLARERFAHWRDGEAEVIDVRLDGEHPDTALVLTFKHRDRPGCVFGFRMQLSLTSAREDGVIDHPESAVNVIKANVDEEIEAADLGLPTDCSAGQVTWL